MQIILRVEGYLFVFSVLIRKTNTMELTNDKTEQILATPNDQLQKQLETISKEKVERVKSFREYAF